MIYKRKIEEFWHWFHGVAALLAADIENVSLLEVLDDHVRALAPELSWEVGPGGNEPWQLVISPNLNPDLRSKAQEIIFHAPVIQGWEFYSARRLKDWNYKLLMQRTGGREPMQLDASGWEFVLLRYPDGELAVLLQGNNIAPLDEDERWQAAAITLESIFGEDVLMDKINEFELVDQLDPQFEKERKPIQLLRKTVLAT